MYKVTGTDTVSVVGATKKTLKKISISSTVTYNGATYKVTGISDKAFYKNTKVKTITIGANVEVIGNSAFEGCTKLTKITVGKNVKLFGTSVFKKCKKLGNITIKSQKLKAVGKNTFKSIKSTAKIKVPAKKLKAYKKLLKGKGQGKKVKIVK